MTESKKMKKAQELLGEFQAGMLITRDYHGSMHSRPMIIAEIDEEARLYFISNLEGDKVEEVRREPHVGITLQNDGAFVALSGVAEIISDLDAKRRIWSQDGNLWFEGPEDKRAGIIRVTPHRLEYWDQRGLNAVKIAFQAMVAKAQGEVPHLTASQHAYVRL